MEVSLKQSVKRDTSPIIFRQSPVHLQYYHYTLYTHRDQLTLDVQNIFEYCIICRTFTFHVLSTSVGREINSTQIMRNSKIYKKTWKPWGCGSGVCQRNNYNRSMLAKIWTQVRWHVFMVHGVSCLPRTKTADNALHQPCNDDLYDELARTLHSYRSREKNTVMYIVQTALGITVAYLAYINALSRMRHQTRPYALYIGIKRANNAIYALLCEQCRVINYGDNPTLNIHIVCTSHGL